MTLYDLFQTLLDVQNCVPAEEGGASTCPGTVLHAITAAFATQGYWVQADLLWYLTNTGMQTWAILIYVIAAVGGIVSMAMGMPPRLYLWFFLGPGIYHWLIQDTVNLHGVRWNVGPRDSDDEERWERAQREVWKLAETGLAGTNIAARGNYDISASAEPEGGINGDGTVAVSNLFSWYDRIISSLVEWSIRWTGLYNLPVARGSGDSFLVRAQTAALGIQTANGSDNDRTDDQNWLLSNLKWRVLDDITSARLHSMELRDAFVTFLASECGDMLTLAIDEGKYISAATGKAGQVPADGVFINTNTQGLGTVVGAVGAGGLIGGRYNLATQLLMNQSIPTPRSVQQLLSNDSMGSFRRSMDLFNSEDFLEDSNILETIRCDQFLYLVVNAFRWEAGHTYYQLVNGLPAGMAPANLLNTFFNGWAFQKLQQEDGFLDFGSWKNILNNLAGEIIQMDNNQYQNFFTDLILIHLFRNEMDTAPIPFQRKKGASAETISYVEKYQRTVGSKNKFGEVYTWALMMPYMQGILLYLLAIAYPFCCLMMLIPGWHKIIFTWMSFWAWAKIWDIGFAIVLVLERSIWAMLGNTSNSSMALSKIMAMQDYAKVKVTCPSNTFGGAISFGGPPESVCAPGVIPQVLVGANGAAAPAESWYDTMAIFDKALTFAANLDLDLQNSYYIYLMSALYFAVPAVTGQLVLGAKAGASGMIQSAIGGTASEGGRAAGSGFTGDMTARAKMSSGTIGHTAHAKSLREDPGKFASNALSYGNAAQMQGLKQAVLGQQSEGINRMAKASSFGWDNEAEAQQIANNAITGLGNQVLGGRGGSQQGAGRSASQYEPQTRAAPTGASGASSGAGAGAGSGGATGVSPASGGLGSALNGVAQRAGPAVGDAIKGIANQGLQMRAGIVQAGLREQQRQQQVAYDDLQNRMGVESFAARQMGGMYQDAAGKNEQGAEYNAQMAAYDAQNKTFGIGGHAAGNLAAMGVMAGTGVQDNKPRGLQSMAIAGDLGRSAQNKAMFTDPNRGGYFQAIRQAHAGLAENYGSGSAMARYSNTQDIGSAFGRYFGSDKEATAAATSAARGQPGAFQILDKNSMPQKPAEQSLPVDITSKR